MDGRLDFFVVGAQKAGTTALETFLRSHPQVQMGRKKELHFFDNENVDWTSPDYAALNASFDWNRSDVLRGEATPIYMYWPKSLERIRAYNRNAKLIVLLRHPACRAYSHWKMEVSRGKEDFPFRLAVADVGRLRIKVEPGGVHRVFSYVERGYYSSQIARIFRQFPLRNVLFLRTDDLWRDPAQSFARVSGFLGIDAQGFRNVAQEYVIPVKPLDMAPMSDEERADLDAIYRTDMEDTALLSGLDLSDWFDPHYVEPMQPGLYPARVGLAA